VAALHRIQWIDAQIRAARYPNARRVAERFEISHRQAQRDFEYLRDSLGAPLLYSALRRGYRYHGEAYVLPGPFVTPLQRGVLGHLAAYYARSAARGEDPVLEGMAELFTRLSGGAPALDRRAAPGAAPSAPAVGLPFLARLSLPGPARLPGMTGLGVPVPDALAPYYRGDDGPHQITCEFHDADAFLAALLGAGPPFRVEYPAWLHARLAARVDELRAANATPPGGTRSPRRGAAATRGVVPAGVGSGHPQTLERSAPMPATETAARMQTCWTTFVGAAQGVLDAAGLIDPRLDTSALMGLSGRAFHLTLDDTCWPGCATLYDWPREHATAFERIGVLAEVFQAGPDSPTYDAARRRAVTHIKAALDRGLAVVLWGVDAPEFGVVYGYDDADGVFLVDGVARLNGRRSTPILYDNVGRSSDVPELHYVVPVERVPWDATAAHLAALRDYLARTEVRPQLVPKYPSGLRAYDNWLTALESGTFVPFGLRYNTAVLADARKHAATYLERLAAEGLLLPHLAEAGAVARENAVLFRRMLEVLGMDGPAGAASLGQPVAPAQAQALAPLVRQARGLEARQLDLVKQALAGEQPA
jgi:predicted DNA-binding transcriptional regulator YafY